MNVTPFARRAWQITLVFGFLMPGVVREGVSQARGPDVGAEIGQEMDKVRRDVIQPATPPTKKTPDVMPGERKREIPGQDEADPRTFKVAAVAFDGDVAILSRLGLRETFEKRLVGKTLTRGDIAAAAGELENKLRKEGFYLARVQVETAAGSSGTLRCTIDLGRIGTIRLVRGAGEDRRPYQGRFYSGSQIEERLRALEEGAFFNYAEFYRVFYALNAHPDLKVDADLKVRTEADEGMSRRYVDMEFEVADRLPLHAVLSLNNAGTDVTDEWGAGLTLQYLNLTRRDDVLTFTLPVSLDLQSIRSIAGSYSLPYEWGKGGAFTLFGGYSKIDAVDIVPEIDLDGEGWFAGAQISQTLARNEERQIAVSAGLSYSVIEDTLYGGDGEALTPREVTLAPLNLGVSYEALVPDAWKGRNSLSVGLTGHVGGFLGSSEEEEFEAQRQNAEPDFFKARVQGARVQPVMQGPSDGNDWIVFGRLTGQYADGALIPAEQMAADARGYEIREALGDHGISGTLELRTPILRSRLLPSRFQWIGDEGEDYERLQFLAFVDGSLVALEETLSGEEDRYEFLSAGMGMRFSIGSHFQARFDWGFPIEETEDSESAGRGHINVQFMY